MRITFIRPVAHSGGGAFRDIAEFDVEVADGLTLQAVRLATAPSGGLRVFAPSKNGVKFARFSGDYAPRLADAAFAALKTTGWVADEQRAS